MDDLLKEAIADAKAVRETALANAKMALEEAFTPKLKSMLSKKIQAEMDVDEQDEEAPEEEKANPPFLWVLTDRRGTKSLNIRRYFPNEHNFVVKTGQSSYSNRSPNRGPSQSGRSYSNRTSNRSSSQDSSGYSDRNSLRGSGNRTRPYSSRNISRGAGKPSQINHDDTRNSADKSPVEDSNSNYTKSDSRTDKSKTFSKPEKTSERIKSFDDKEKTSVNTKSAVDPAKPAITFLFSILRTFFAVLLITVFPRLT